MGAIQIKTSGRLMNLDSIPSLLMGNLVLRQWCLEVTNHHTLTSYSSNLKYIKCCNSSKWRVINLKPYLSIHRVA